MSEDGKQPQDQGGRVVLIAVGAVLVVVGVVNLGGVASGVLGPLWRPFGMVFGTVREWALPLAALVAGILLIVMSRRENVGFRLPSRQDRLYRSRKDSMLSGVLGGLARYFSVDATLLRLGVVLAVLLLDAWPVIVAYVAAAIIVPQEPPDVPAS